MSRRYYFCLLVLLMPCAAQAQLDVIRQWFTPPVVPNNYTGTVRYEATVTGGPSTVTFLYDGVDRTMYDDGTNGGDLTAADGTYTTTFTANEIISKLTAARVFRPHIGFCRLNTTAAQFNVFGEVWTPSIGLAPVTPLAADAQRTDYVINFTATKLQFMTFSASYWSQKLYTYFGDHFDFINFVLVQGMRGNRYHAGVRNAVSGIGTSLYNNGTSYGSASRLKGLNVFPSPSFYDGGNSAFSHETGHQWINFLSGTPYATGTPHWPKGNVATNVMGFSLPSSGAGGNYLYSFTPNGSGGYVVGNAPTINLSTFNAMELYLMGLAPPSEVPDYFVLANQNQNISSGQTLTSAEVTPVTINDIISAKGARSPDSNSAQRIYRYATVVLSESLLEPEAISLYDFFTRRTEATTQLNYADGFSTGVCNPFQLATGNRAFAISKMIGAQPSNIALSATSVPEDSPANTQIGTFSTTDADAGEAFTYSFINGPGSTDNAAFSISGSYLHLLAVPDYETQSSYSIRVRSTDSAGLYFDKAFTISITRTLTIQRQILGLVHHFTPPQTSSYPFLGSVVDELLIENAPITNVNLALYSNIKVRLYVPGGTLSVGTPAGSPQVSASAYLNFTANSDAISLSSTATPYFENMSGILPTNTYNFAGLGDGGNALLLIREENLTGSLLFSAWSYLFTPSNQPANSPKTFVQGSGSSIPVSFYYSTTAPTDPGPFVTVTSPLIAFRQTYFGSNLTAPSAADLADADADGIANLAEFAFGLNPLSGASRQLPQPQLSAGAFVTSFTQPAGVSGITYSAEWSATLLSGSWTPIPDSGSGGTHIFSVPVGSNTRIFIRYGVTVQP